MNLYLYLRHFPPQGDRFNEGLTKAVHGLASGLVECGASVTVLCEASATETSVHQSAAGYKIHCFVQPIQHRPSFTLSPELRQFLRQLDRPSLVILNGILHPSVYAMSRLLRRQKVPYIIAPHDPYNPAIFKKNAHLKLPYWYLLEKRMLNRARAVQVLDPRHEQWLRQLGVHSAVIATPNGFATEDVVVEAEAGAIDRDPVRLFFLGRIETYNKGLDLLLDAFAQVKQQHPVQLTLQGPDWGDRATLEAQAAQLGMAEHVTFLPPDYDKSPALLAAHHDIFCIPSRFEGFSMAALEAMLAGRVLLVSEIAGIAPYVQASDCGVVVQPTVEGIRQGIGELLQRRSQWHAMGQRGRWYALEHLQWDKIAATALKHYQQLVS
ncbi:MAG: glycosyltransferase [Leptolyngbyaceae cyanobacterium SL_7_1]|nr:glycosyltransferase [Leptolyngbyaceae cyanobacterium SL_7_1]